MANFFINLLTTNLNDIFFVCVQYIIEIFLV